MAYKYCPECGTKLEPGMKFCPGCGTAVSSSSISNIVSSSNAARIGTLTVTYDGEWVIFSSKYEFHYNGKHYSDFSFKDPFRYDLPLEQGRVKLKVKKLFLSWSFDFTLDPSQNYIAKLTYSRISKQFNLSVYDENNRRIYKDTLF